MFHKYKIVLQTALTSPKRGTYFKHLTTSHSITILLNAPVSALDMSKEQMVYKACQFNAANTYTHIFVCIQKNFLSEMYIKVLHYQIFSEV